MTASPAGQPLDNTRIPFVSWDRDVGEGGWVTGVLVGVVTSKYGDMPTELLKLRDGSGEHYLVSLTTGLRQELERHKDKIKGKVLHLQWTESRKRFRCFQVHLAESAGEHYDRYYSTLTREPTEGLPGTGEEDDLPF